jgi:hypothetical protein
LAYNTKNIITDLSALKPVPQYFNKVADQYEAAEGSFGASNVQLWGTKIKDSFAGTANTTKDYTAAPMRGLSVQNDGAADITFVVNALTITVKPNEGFNGEFEPFTSLQINASVAFRAVVKG